MARYERDFMGRVRGMFHRIAGGDPRPRHRLPMDASGPGAEGYYLSREMAYDAQYALNPRVPSRYAGGGYDRGMAQFGRAGRGRGYGGDYQTGRGGPDRGEFFVNRHPGDSGYGAGGYERDLGARGGRGYAPGGRGYGAEYGGRGFPMGYDRGYRVGYRGSGGYGGYDGYAGYGRYRGYGR
ncbi:MAG: hypothetical protein KY467_16455 [Gemmatimonadetes bacterium]|nr:hypothetical protein [Gemmatimonadota bacterium]